MADATDRQGKAGVPAGEGGEGGAGGAGGDPSGQGGAGGQGGEGGQGAASRSDRDRRSIRVTDWVVGCAAVLALVVSIVNYVQQDNLRDAQGETDASSEALADYLAYIGSEPSTIERIRLSLEQSTGTSLPDLPPTPTTTVPG